MRKEFLIRFGGRIRLLYFMHPIARSSLLCELICLHSFVEFAHNVYVCCTMRGRVVGHNMWQHCCAPIGRLLHCAIRIVVHNFSLARIEAAPKCHWSARSYNESHANIRTLFQSHAILSMCVCVCSCFVPRY